nr:immunoglobulin light chain junction region [Macaca mulatta]MOW27587.1 immunoglobulin light chain junction region [Macaca mulatta]MOW28028.1 immunoglobulin light chain junction region [Macaca mulatta]MOW28282.1 immunoglobulin light chain junction region [Macaca mulatta]MOW28701.1 immunoglobulin light chain junction region [Macaca mulatta]
DYYCCSFTTTNNWVF